MKLSLAVQFLSPAFAAAVASPSSVSVAEELAKKYGNHRDMNAAAAAATSRASRDLVSIHTTSTSKSSKSSVSCPPEPTPDVQCGNVYTDSTVILGQNLICAEGRDGAQAALTLKGKKAELNCQGYTISQNTNSSAAAMDCPPNELGLGLCGLFYFVGVRLEDGATMKNCNIQKFFYGAFLNGGEIKDSEFSLNRRGVQISNLSANTVSTVVNSEFYNNYGGLYAYQINDDDDAKVMIEDVTAKNNEYDGIFLTGAGITVNNAISRNNEYGLYIGSNEVNEITLDGDVSITNSEVGIVTKSNTQGTVRVTGNLISNRNVVGLLPLSDNFTIAVGGSYSGKSGKSGSSGSLTACENNQYDINNAGGITFEGSDYTCETKVGTNLPECKPCPGCL